MVLSSIRSLSLDGGWALCTAAKTTASCLALLVFVFKTVLEETLKLGCDVSLSVLAVPLQIQVLRYSVYCNFCNSQINT